jgi:SAM-dependent methyltransferase
VQRRKQRFFIAIASLLLALTTGGRATTEQAPPQNREPDVVYIPTPFHVVDAMLRGALVTPKDVVYDLGCGDGRIVIQAAKIYGARGVGIDIDRERIREAEANARKGGVGERVRFRWEDLFEADIREASVVTLYLLPELNLKLRPKLWRELQVGARVVSHGYDMGDWTPERILILTDHPVYFWTITEKIKRRLEMDLVPECGPSP